MKREIILKEINILPEHLKVQVFNYIRFLNSAESISIMVDTKKPKFGFGKYKIKISEDFDAPLDDFKAYT